MTEKQNQNRFFVLSYPLLLLSSLIFSVILFRWDWPCGLGYLSRVFEIQLVFVAVLWLLYLFRQMPVRQKYAGAALVWGGTAAVWSLGFPDPGGPDIFLIRTVTGLLILGAGAGVEQAILLEEKRNQRAIEQLADEARLTETHLAYLRARVEPEFLLMTLKGISRLRGSDMARAGQLQMKLVEYLRETLAPGGTGRDKGILRREILAILEGP